jgi:hypothetical protein
MSSATAGVAVQAANARPAANVLNLILDVVFMFITNTIFYKPDAVPALVLL